MNSGADPLPSSTEQPTPTVEVPEGFLSRTFRSFQFRDFRLMWTGACISQVGTQMQTAAQSWTVLEISHNNSRYLGIDQFLGQIPIVMFALLAGVLADRRDRRTIILSSQYTQMVCAFTMAALAFAGPGVLRVEYIWCLSFIIGTAQAFGGPSYSALVPTLVPKEHLPNAIALNSIQFNLARVVGPSLAGLALLLGAAWCFTANGISFLVVIAMLYIINVSFVPRRSSEPIMNSMRQGFGFILDRPAMKPLIMLSFMVTLLGFQIIGFLPVFVKEAFGDDARIYTTLLSVSGAGAVTGALMVAALGKRHQGRNALVALAVLGIFTAGFAFSPNVYVASLMLFLAGVALMSVFNMITSLVQLIVPDEMRGRVLSVYNLAVRGGGPIGSLVVGFLIPIYTARYVIAGAGALLLCLGVYFLLFNRRVTEL